MVDGAVSLDGLGVEALVRHEEVLAHVQHLHHGVYVVVVEGKARRVVVVVRPEDRLNVCAAGAGITQRRLRQPPIFKVRGNVANDIA